MASEMNTMKERSIFQASYVNKILEDFVKQTAHTLHGNEGDSEMPTLLVPLGLWSDGCDAGSASKANRNLVKLTTLHFVNPHIKE